MDKSHGLAERTEASAPTREKLMAAAAELVAELGWGRVTTRAVAERAGLPHGAVSYHFRGKQELLIEAAMFAFARAVPAGNFTGLAGVEDLIGLISAEVADRDAIDPVLSRLMLEAMREAERDSVLRQQMSEMLSHYRELMVQTVRADQERGVVFNDASAEAIATLLGAVGDGLLLHALLDPELDVHAALDALRVLLAPRCS
ncbi:MAG TPA: TetR/AcrR family transcriptional regulator [Solirubrobacteraceae bacterium]|nr:TetR/AcrR family transcriptional regulator [Solirubrobacteraceae bacterium]